MTTSIIISAVLAIVFVAAAAALSLRRDLTMFQQNSYRPERYRRWLNESGESTTAHRLGALIVFLFVLTPFCPPMFGLGCIAGYSVIYGTWLLRRKYKKPLAMTHRAARIYAICCALAVLIAAAVWLVSARTATSSEPLQNGLLAAAEALLLVCALPWLIVLGNTLLKPVEKSINKRYYNDARQRLKAMPALKIIGVTGSYGKTTTKHYLQRILSERYETLMTPGSYNTTLGVIRTIREMLKPYHEVFIVEMGAKQTGDIKEICDLVEPSAGIITAVGPQHLESFKTIENVRDTKFELADSIPADGIVIINNDFPMIATREVGNTRCIRYGVSSEAAYKAENITYTPEGTRFTVTAPDGWSLDLATRLVGECNISNLLAAVAMARQLGVPDESIRYAVARIEQVEHRLSIKRVPGGLTIIDDAFNSNPVGSAMALDVLAAMTQGKRILITPGMIELGEQQHELNEQFGFKAASCCDIAIVVGRYNRDAIVAGLERGGMPAEAIRPVDTFAEAQQLLSASAAAGDTVLYENDLPDTFK